MSLKYVRHGCLGWVAVCGLWDGGSERRWKWRLKPEASLKHCLLLLLGHLLLTHTSGISLLDLKKSKTWITRSSRTKRTESTWSQSQALQFLLHGHYLLLLTPQTPRNPSWSRKWICYNKDNRDIEDIKDRNYLKPISCIASFMDTCWSRQHCRLTICNELVELTNSISIRYSIDIV